MKLIERKEHYVLACYFLLIICAAFALSYPLAFRTATSGQLFVSEKSYEILLQSQNIKDLSHITQPNSWLATPTSTPAPFSISNYLYALLILLVPIWTLPALISFLLLTLLWIALNTFSIPLSARFITACMFAFSPLFVATQLSLGPAAFLLLFISLLILSLRSHWKPLLCAIIALICGLFGVEAILMLIIILIFSVQREGHAPITNQKKYAAVAAAIGFLTWLTLSIITKTSFSSLFEPRILSNLFVDFGAQSGQTVLLVLLALIGAANVWKKELRWHFVAALAILLWSAFFPNTALMATAILSYFAGSAFTKIWNSTWTHKSLKMIVLASILIAVLTSYFIFSNQLIVSNPTQESVNAYVFINENTNYNSVIFSTSSEAPMIAYFSHRFVTSTDNPSHALYEEQKLQTQKILYSKTLSQVLNELQNISATHILIDPQLRSSNDWREDKGGLALLLRNKRAFSLIYDNEGYSLYRVNYDVK